MLCIATWKVFQLKWYTLLTWYISRILGFHTMDFVQRAVLNICYLYGRLGDSANTNILKSHTENMIFSSHKNNMASRGHWGRSRKWRTDELNWFSIVLDKSTSNFHGRSGASRYICPVKAPLVSIRVSLSTITRRANTTLYTDRD